MEGAMELDQEVKAAKMRGDKTPHDDFNNQRFRQPALNEGKLKPSLYRHGKSMLPESVYGPAARGSFRRASMSGSQHSPGYMYEPGFIEDPNGGSVYIKSPLAATGMNPLHQPQFQPPPPVMSSVAFPTAEDEENQRQYASRRRADSTIEFEGDDVDEFEEEAEYPKDVDAAVDALLEDENKRTAVNAVSQQISSLRRSSVMGQMPAVVNVVPGFRRSSHGGQRRESNADQLSPDSMRVHTFTSRDLDELHESEQVRGKWIYDSTH